MLPSFAVRRKRWRPSYRVRILSLLVVTGLPMLLLAVYGLSR